MKSKNTKTLQIFFISLFVSVGIFSVLGNNTLAAKNDTKQLKEENLKKYNCVPKDSCDQSQGYKFIPNTDSRANACPNNQGRCVVDKSIRLNVPIPGSGSSVNSINDYVDNLFKWLLQLGGVIAAAVIVWGGYIYITAAGNQAKISQAKETITGGIIGLVLLFGSVTLLGFFNQRILENVPVTVDKIKTEKYSTEFCTDEDPTPTEVSCGKPSQNKDGSRCISDNCGSNNICVYSVFKIGSGLSGSKKGYKCIDKTSASALEDACEESYGLVDFKFCDKIDRYLRSTNSSKACGFGWSNKDVKECKLGIRLEEPILCSDCNLSPNTGTLMRGSIEYKAENTSVYKSIKFDENGEDKFMVFCGNAGTGQAKWQTQPIDQESNIKLYLGAICKQGDEKIYTGY